MMIDYFYLIWERLANIDFWLTLFRGFQAYGPVPPILLAYLESLIPMLPLVAIITFNIGSHGVFWGFVFSWAGSVLGSITVFLLFSYLRHKPLLTRLLGLKRAERIVAWVRRQRRGVLFLLAIFPFTPSFMINISFGLAGYDRLTFITTIMIAKSLMIASLTMFGTSVLSGLQDPAYIILAIALIGGLYLLSLYASKRSGIDKI